MATFDAALLGVLDAAEEVRIQTGGRRPVIIWVVVEGREVFVRSVRGPRGRWYRDLMVEPEGRLLGPGLPSDGLAFRAIAAGDPASIERCTHALAAKYAADPSLGLMVEPDTLPTTLRLEPR